jgi:hypothetical protein
MLIDKLILIVSVIGCAVGLLIAPAHAERTVEVDGYGNVQYHKPQSKELSDGRTVKTDGYGNIQYHKPQSKELSDGRTVQTDGYGNVQYHKPQQKRIR